MDKIRVPVILGPTAVGKTDFVLHIAEALGYEVLSCDSRQIYRRMDIGTAKPSLAVRERVRHWLVDILEPSEPYSAFAFAHDALRVIRKSRESGKKILICGGTGLYYHILSNGAGDLDEADLELRGSLQEEARIHGSAALHGRLAAADPDAAAKIHPNDLQRLLRALDILYRRGQPLSELQGGGRPPEDIDFHTVVVSRPREVLYERINKRVDMMFELGLREEFEALRHLGYTEASPGMVCVGYRELFAVEKGEASLEQAVELVKRNTRRYAKRQMTWFRNKVHGTVIDVDADNGKRLLDYLIQF